MVSHKAVTSVPHFCWKPPVYLIIHAPPSPLHEDCLSSSKIVCHLPRVPVRASVKLASFGGNSSQMLRYLLAVCESWQQEAEITLLGLENDCGAVMLANNLRPKNLGSTNSRSVKFAPATKLTFTT